MGDKQLDRYEVIDLLGITNIELTRLRRSPIFPRPSHKAQNLRDVNKWDRRDVKAFRKCLEHAKARGWNVPDCLYAWLTPDELEEDRRRVERRTWWPGKPR